MVNTVNLERLIATSVEAGATAALVNLGISAGEMSQRKARDTYGKWFMDADKMGRIHPVRVDNGKGTKWYRVTDILQLKIADASKAELIIK